MILKQTRQNKRLSCILQSENISYSKRINKLLINGANIVYQHKLKHCQNLTKLLRQFPFDLGIRFLELEPQLCWQKLKVIIIHTYRHATDRLGALLQLRKWKSGVVAHLSPQQSRGSGKGTEQYIEIISQKKGKWK